MVHEIVPLLAPKKQLSREERLEMLAELLKPVQTLPETQIITLDKLVIEEKAPRDSNNNKILYTYDKSLEAIKQRGYQRHLRSNEAFQLMIDAIENPSSKYTSTKEDMLSSYGEWLSLAVLRTKPDELKLYLDPENLVWNSSRSEYVVQGNLKYSQERAFNISKGIPSNEWVDLNKFPNEDRKSVV